MRAAKRVALVVLLAYLGLQALFIAQLVFQPVLKFRLTIPSGWLGRALAVEDPDMPMDYSRVHDLRVEDGIVRVPDGFLSNPPESWTVTEVMDTQGRTLDWGKNGRIDATLVTEVYGSGDNAITRKYFEFFPR